MDNDEQKPDDEPVTSLEGPTDEELTEAVVINKENLSNQSPKQKISAVSLIVLACALICLAVIVYVAFG